MITNHVLRLYPLVRSIVPQLTTVPKIFLYRPFFKMNSELTEGVANTLSDHEAHRETARPGQDVPHVPIPKNGVDYRGKIVLAPMVRSGELPSRLLALSKSFILMPRDCANIGYRIRCGSSLGP